MLSDQRLTFTLPDEDPTEHSSHWILTCLQVSFLLVFYGFFFSFFSKMLVILILCLQILNQ